MTQRDHPKLRPYDLLQAKVGDVVLTQFPEERGQVVALSSKEVAFLWENDHFNSHRLDKEHCLFQPPLAWLGPNPVYAGDTLWIVDENHYRYGTSQVVMAVYDESDNRWLIRGLAHLTKEAAISHAQALLSITQV